MAKRRLSSKTCLAITNGEEDSPRNASVGTVTWAMVSKKRVQFEKLCEQDSLTKNSPELLLQSMMELMTTPQKILGASNLILSDSLMAGPSPKKGCVEKCQDDDLGQDWLEMTKVSQLPKYWIWEFIRSKDTEYLTSAVMNGVDSKDRGFVRKALEALTQLRSSFRVLDKVKNKHVMGKLCQKLYIGLGERFDAFKKLIVDHKIDWSTNGVFTFAPADKSGNITKLQHISGVVADIPRNSSITKDWYFEQNWSDRFCKCTDGHTRFIVYHRFSACACDFWYQLADNPQKKFQKP